MNKLLQHYTGRFLHVFLCLYSKYMFEGCPRSLWTTAVTLSFFGRFDCFLYKIHFKHIRIKNHQHDFSTSSYLSMTRFHRDGGSGYWRTGKSCQFIKSDVISKI